MADSNEKESASWFVVGSVLFICIVMATYVIDRYTDLSLMSPFSGNDAIPGEQAEGSLQPAVDACKRAARQQIGASLLQMDVDSGSTRYRASRQEYEVFLDLILKNNERVAYYYECTVSAVTQRVSRTRVTGPPGTFDKIEF
jgi:hypothetical protein